MKLINVLHAKSTKAFIIGGYRGSLREYVKQRIFGDTMDTSSANFVVFIGSFFDGEEVRTRLPYSSAKNSTVFEMTFALYCLTIW